MSLKDPFRYIPTPDMNTLVRVVIHSGDDHPKKFGLYLVRTEYGDITPMFGTQFGWNTSQSPKDDRVFDTKYKVDDSYIKYWIEAEEVAHGEDA